jgi:Ca2+-transporting ATPase
VADRANNAVLQEHEGCWTVQGDPTEGALIVAARKAGLEDAALAARFARVAEVPFSSERKLMSTIHTDAERQERLLVLTKGAPDVLLARCAQELVGAESRPLTAARRAEILQCNEALAGAALRTLGVACRSLPKNAFDQGEVDERVEHDLVFLGLIGMIDPPRQEAKEAVTRAKAAGIRPIMITGDHPKTAAVIAAELGIMANGRAVTGAELERLPEEALDQTVQDVSVYARVNPEHKLRIVQALQRAGTTVAMTGDGVNDAPALKKADVGIAMGIAGTDVSKEASGMTLLDDNFASIVAAVEEGRIVFGNIKKYLMYLLSCNVGEIVLLAGAVIAGLPMPLTAVQILYVNLATDGLPALALAVDPPETDLMKRRPRNPRIGMFTPPVVVMLITAGVWSALINITLFVWMLRSGRPLEEVMAMTFVLLVLIQFFNAYNCRSDRLSIIKGVFSNRWLNLAVAWELFLLIVITYVPFFQRAFGTFGFSAQDWMLTIALAFSIVPVVEAVKWMARRGWFGEVV